MKKKKEYLDGIKGSKDNGSATMVHNMLTSTRHSHTGRPLKMPSTRRKKQIVLVGQFHEAEKITAIWFIPKS